MEPVVMGGVTWPGAPDWRAWRHVTKLDPDRPLSPAALEAVYASGTDAIVVGGSTGMTFDAVAGLLGALSGAPMPVALEVSSLESAMPGPALFLVPLVLNTNRVQWLGGAQAGALARLLPTVGPVVPWHLVVPEAYLVLNPNSTVAHLTGAHADLDAGEAAGFAALAGRVLRLPLVYVEYSGTFGDMSVLAAVKAAAGDAHVVYGGGIASASQAAQAGAIADTVVVGNLVYSRPDLLAQTVAAVR